MKALVTGGGGFLGGAICRMLRERGDDVRSFSRGEHPKLKELGVEQIRGDIANEASILRAAEGCDTIFHVAAKAGVWGSFDEYRRANVVGTESVIRVCRKLGIAKLIFTSSPSVVFDGTDMEGVNESVPYPDHYHADYPKTKAMAEKLVLAANDEKLATVSLRPHLIWGPGDNHLVPRIIERGRAGKLRRIGKRDNKVDAVYIDNAADAHLLAADKLAPGSTVAGKAYFITNDEPVVVWDFINQILDCAGLPPLKKTISPGLAYFAGSVLETVYRLFGIKSEPRMTRFVARELATAHWFDMSAAKRDFGYLPEVSMKEGLDRFRKALNGDGSG